jgi:hypothetical protein
LTTTVLNALGISHAGAGAYLGPFFFGPDLKVPLSVRIRFFWASVQSLTALLRRSRMRGAEIFPVLIQYCSVARGTPADFATSIVE